MQLFIDIIVLYVFLHNIIEYRKLNQFDIQIKCRIIIKSSPIISLYRIIQSLHSIIFSFAKCLDDHKSELLIMCCCATVDMTLTDRYSIKVICMKCRECYCGCTPL